MTSNPADVPGGATATWAPRHSGPESADLDETSGPHGTHEADLSTEDDSGLDRPAAGPEESAPDTLLPAEDTYPVNAADRDPLRADEADRAGLTAPGAARADGTDLADDDDDSEDDTGDDVLAEDSPAEDSPADGLAHDDLSDDDEGDDLEDDDLEDDPDLIVVEDSMVVSADRDPAPIVMEPAVTDPADSAAAEAADTTQAGTAAADAIPADAAVPEPAAVAPAEPAGTDPVAADTTSAAAGQPGPQVADMGGGTTQFQERWLAIQSDFVDDPHRSVTSAAELVQEAVDSLVTRIKEQETSMRGSWDGPSADTEVLRKVLVDYRSFLDRIAAM